MTNPTNDRDPWLRSALRHAPDADAVPPAAVSASILRAAEAAAKAAAKAAAAPPAPGPWARLWAWLARPTLAPALASITLATVIGVLWWDQPVDPRVAEPEAAAPAAAVASAPVPPVELAKAQPAPPPLPPAAVRDAARAPLMKRASAPAADTEPAAAAQSTTSATAEPESAAPAQTANASALELRAPPAAQRAEAGAAARSMQSFPAVPQALLRSVRVEPARWSWALASGSDPRPVDADWLAWLAQLEAAAAWVPSAESVAAPPTLRLLRDGRGGATLHLGATQAGIELAGRAWTAPLTAEQSTALRAALDALPR